MLPFTFSGFLYFAGKKNLKFNCVCFFFLFCVVWNLLHFHDIIFIWEKYGKFSIFFFCCFLPFIVSGCCNDLFVKKIIVCACEYQEKGIYYLSPWQIECKDKDLLEIYIYYYTHFVYGSVSRKVLTFASLLFYLSFFLR
jgi:hypothetical protein